MPLSIDVYCKAMAEGLLRRSREPGSDVWPQPIFHPMEAVHYGSSEMLDHLHECLVVGAQLPPSIDEMKSQMPYPSSLSHFTYLFLEKPKSRSEAEKRTRSCQVLLKIIAGLRQGDAFCSGKANRILSEREVASLDSRLSTLGTQSSGIRSIGSAIGRLNVALGTLCEFTFFSNITFGREIHGPYQLHRYRTVIVRDYHDVHATYWLFTEGLPFRSVRVATAHSELEAEMDFSGRMHTAGCPNRSLSGALLEVDGAAIEMRESAIVGFLRQIEAALDAASAEVEGLGRQELVLRYIAGFAHVLKQLGANLPRNEFGVSEVLTDRILGGQEECRTLRIISNLHRASVEERQSILEVLFDPRKVAQDLDNMESILGCHE